MKANRTLSMLSARRSARKKSPPTCGTWRDEYREKLIEAVADEDDEHHGDVPGGRQGRRERHPRGPARAARSVSASCPSSAEQPTSNKGVISRCWTPSWITCRRRWISSAMTGINPKTDEEEPVKSATTSPSPPWRSRSRPTRLSASLCFFRVYLRAPLNKGSTVLNATEGYARAPRPDHADARQPPARTMDTVYLR